MTPDPKGPAMTDQSGGHTPGPWFFGQSPNMRVHHPNQRSIALSLEPDGTPFGYRLGADDDDGAYLNLSGLCYQADARLIAAAPDLLAACEAFIAALEGANVDYDDLAANTRAAITLATGAAS